MNITPEQIADLTDREQQKLARWISEDSHLSELSSRHKSRQTQALAQAQIENESPDAQHFMGPD